MEASMNKHFPVFLLAAWQCAFGQDIRDFVKSNRSPEVEVFEIDPDKQIFGIPYGTSEDDVLKKLGKADGYFRINKNTTAILYGGYCSLIFRNDSLDGVKVGHGQIDWRLMIEMPEGVTFRFNNWMLKNGIKAGMTLKEAGKKADIKDSKYGKRFETEKAVIEIEVGVMSGSKDKDEATIISGLYIRRK